MKPAKYAYHATTQGALDDLRHSGLLPSPRSIKRRGEPVIFFTPRAAGAYKYFIDREDAVLLRFPWPPDAERDDADEFILRRPVPPGVIEVYEGRALDPLVDAYYLPDPEDRDCALSDFVDTGVESSREWVPLVSGGRDGHGEDEPRRNPAEWWRRPGRVSLEEAQHGYKYFRLIPPPDSEYNEVESTGVGKARYVERPRVPRYTMKGENKTTPRVVMSSTIAGCIAGIAGEVSPDEARHDEEAAGRVWEFLVYGTRDEPRLVPQSVVNRAVPDARLTGEVWSKEPVEFELIGIIGCDSSQDDEFDSWVVPREKEPRENPAAPASTSAALPEAAAQQIEAGSADVDRIRKIAEQVSSDLGPCNLQCRNHAEVLCGRLKDEGFDAKHVWGYIRVDGNFIDQWGSGPVEWFQSYDPDHIDHNLDHHWVEVAGYVVDTGCAQFNQLVKGERFPEVYVESIIKAKRHRKEEIVSRRSASKMPQRRDDEADAAPRRLSDPKKPRKNPYDDEYVSEFEVKPRENPRYYHGGAERYAVLKEGDGVDGQGIYLTSDLRRAQMYSRRGAGGVEREGGITEVWVDTDAIKVWDDEAQVDLRDYAPPNAPWLRELVEKHGPEACRMTGQNARIWLGWKSDNSELKQHGFQAIKRHHDLVVLDPSVVQYGR